MKTSNRLTRLLQAGALCIMVMMPFHAFFTTWAGSNTGGLLAWRAWKEVLLVLMMTGGLYVLLKDKELHKIIWSRTLNKLIFVYAMWLIASSVISGIMLKDYDALVQGFAIDLRFLLFFVLVQIAFHYKPLKREALLRVLLIPSVAVIIFGFMQIAFLPKTFLEWFGYKKGVTIPPFFTVDEQVSRPRFTSFLSGPNTLGAYLVLPITVVMSQLHRSISMIKRQKKPILLGGLYLIVALTVLYGTHSRSAWIAMMISIGVYVLFRLPRYARLAAVVGAAVLLIGGGLFTYQYRQTQFVQDVILHDDQEEGGPVSSNQARFEAYGRAISDIRNRPLFGCGVGCAGPASVRSENGLKIAENYYLQVAQEAGVIALGLFIAIVGVVGVTLYKKRHDDIHLVLLASLIGLSAANLLLHTWADDTLAYVWWGTLAIVLFGLQGRSNPAATRKASS